MADRPNKKGNAFLLLEQQEDKLDFLADILGGEDVIVMSGGIGTNQTGLHYILMDIRESISKAREMLRAEGQDKAGEEG